jgi:LCP family protein required for cell wall assembly
MGLDRRPGETGLGYRTDTMLLLSLDPRTQGIGVLSIPRDLYVDVPGYSALRRINEPMALGELQRLNYGPILAMETVQYNLGIRVNNYIIVDFQAFVQIVDALGGIEVTTEYVIDDQYYPTMNYGYERFYLSAGRNLLDGQTALKFARTRHGDSDIERGKRQQQVIFALLDKVSKPENLPQVLGQVPALWNALQDNFYTNLSLDQMVQLGLYVKDIPREKINSGSISYENLMDYTTPQGAQVLIPNRARLGELMASVFGASYSE